MSNFQVATVSWGGGASSQPGTSDKRRIITGEFQGACAGLEDAVRCGDGSGE